MRARAAATCRRRVPTRKPSRMPRFTHGTARHVAVGVALAPRAPRRAPARRAAASTTVLARRSGSARRRRASPRARSMRSARSTARRRSAVMRRQRAPAARERRARRAAACASVERHERKAQHVLDRAHHRQRRLHRNRVRLDERRRASTASGAVQRARAGEVAARRTRRTSSRHRAAASRCDTTEITPSPPAAMTASVSASSPDSTAKSGGPVAQDRPRSAQVARRFLHRDDVRDARRARASSRASMLLPVRPGHVVDDDRQVAPRRRSRGSARRCRAAAACCTSARRAAGASRRPPASRATARSRAAVSFEPAPATTGTRPAACSTVISTTRRCSSGVIVAASPVEPHGTRKWMPSAICQSTSARSAPRRRRRRA